MDTQLVQTDTGIRLAFPEPADGSNVSGVLRTMDMRRGSADAVDRSQRQAGVATSIMTLCKTIIGSGLLALPHALAQTGLVFGVVLLVLVGAVQAFVLHLLAVCVKNALDTMHDRADPPSFYSLSVAAGLPPVFVECCVGLATFGFATSYLLVMGDQAPLIFSDIVGPKITPHSIHALTTSKYAGKIWITILGGFVGLPWMMRRSLKSMALLQIIGNLGCVYLVVITALICFGVMPGCNSYASGSMGGLDYGYHNGDEHLAGMVERVGLHNYTACGGDLELVPPVKFVPWEIYWSGNVAHAASVLSIYVFAFACTQSLPPIMAELKDCTIRRVDAVISVSLLVCTLLFVITAVCGYLYYGQNVDPDLLKDFPSNAFSTLARVALLTSVVGSFPVFMFIVRSSLCKVCFGVEATTLPLAQYVGVTIGIFLVSYGISMVETDLSVVLGFVGSTVGMLVGFTFPAFIYMKLGASGHSPGLSSPGSIVPSTGSLNESVTTASTPLLVPGTANRRDAVWILSALLVVISAVLIPVLVGVQIWLL